MSPKNVKKLADKKYRIETGLFIVEGEKNIRELLQSDFVVSDILGTSQFLDSILEEVNAYDERMQTRVELKETKQDELERTGTLMTNAAGIAVVKQKEAAGIDTVVEHAKEHLVLVLDDVRDPGNLGTIIRTADWYGVKYIIASPTTTDFYNPKTVSATMGAFTRINVIYAALTDLFEQTASHKLPVIAALLDGKNAHTAKLPHTGFLLMGSESHGIAKDLIPYTTHKVTIPRFGDAESLNVSVATGILLDTLRRGS